MSDQDNSKEEYSDFRLKGLEEVEENELIVNNK